MYWFVVTEMNIVCGFHNMEPWSQGKRLVSVMWRKIIQQVKPDLSFDMDAKLHAFVL